MEKISIIFYFLLISLDSSSQTVTELINKGNASFSKSQYDSALHFFNKAWKIDSSIYQLHLGRAASHQGLGEVDISYLLLTKAIEKYPDSAYAYELRGRLLSIAHYNSEAISDYTKALQLVGEDSIRLKIFLARGTVFAEKRDFQKAYEDYTRAYLLDTTNKHTINNIATVLDDLGRIDEGIEQLKKILRLDSSYLGSYVNLGYQYTKLGKYEEAIAFFNKALTIEKDNPLTLSNRSLAKYFLKDYQGAMEDVNKSLSLYPTNSFAYKNRALIYIALKQKEKACLDIQAAIDNGFTGMYGNEILELKKSNCPTSN